MAVRVGSVKVADVDEGGPIGALTVLLLLMFTFLSFSHSTNSFSLGHIGINNCLLLLMGRSAPCLRSVGALLAHQLHIFESYINYPTKINNVQWTS